jgi:hypothetical protein
MNQRIRQLAEKANIEFTYDPTEKPVRAFVECWEDELEKFAELIVRECAQAMLDYGKTYAHLSAGEYQSNEFSKVIKQHFGVEL